MHSPAVYMLGTTMVKVQSLPAAQIILPHSFLTTVQYEQLTRIKITDSTVWSVPMCWIVVIANKRSELRKIGDPSPNGSADRPPWFYRFP